MRRGAFGYRGGVIGSLLWMLAAVVQAPEPPRYGGFLAQIDGLEEPAAVAVGPGDEVFVVERFAHRVRVFDATGKELRSFGGLGAGEGQLLEPRGIAVTAEGEVLVADAGNERVVRFGRDGAAGGVVRPPGMRPGDRYDLEPAAVDAAPGYLLVADARRGGLERWALDERGSAAGVAPWAALGAPVLGGPGEIERPSDVAIAGDVVWLVDAARHELVRYEPSSRGWSHHGGFGAYPGQLAHPSGIDVAAGRVYVADRENHRVQVFDERGQHLYAWGIHALRPHEGQGRIHYPNDVAIAPSGAFAVVCEGFENRVQVFGPETDESVLGQAQQERTTAAHFGFGISAAREVMAVVEPTAPDLLVYDLTQEEPIEISRVGMHGDRIGTLRQPVDVELDEAGDLLFSADADARRIDLWRIAREPGEPLRYDPLLADLVQSYAFASATDQKARPWMPLGVEPVALELDRSGGLWVLDAASSGVLRLPLKRDGERIVGFDPSRTISIGPGWSGRRVGHSSDFVMPIERPPAPALSIPTDLALSRDGALLYVVDAGEQRVEAYRVADLGSKTTEPAFAFGGFGTEPGRFVRPTGIAAGRDGFVYVTDEGAHRILKFDERGTFVAGFGKQGLGKVEFYKPRGIDQGPDGHLYVVDHGNHRGQVLTSDGAFVKAFGSRLFLQPILQAR